MTLAVRRDCIVYTVAANDKALLIGCNAANIFGSIVPFDLILRRSGVDTYIAKDLRIPERRKRREVMKGRIVMVAGDQLAATAGIDDAYDVIASLLTELNDGWILFSNGFSDTNFLWASLRITEQDLNVETILDDGSEVHIPQEGLR